MQRRSFLATLSAPLAAPLAELLPERETPASPAGWRYIFTPPSELWPSVYFDVEPPASAACYFDEITGHGHLAVLSHQPGGLRSFLILPHDNEPDVETFDNGFLLTW